MYTLSALYLMNSFAYNVLFDLFTKHLVLFLYMHHVLIILICANYFQFLLYSNSLHLFPLTALYTLSTSLYEHSSMCYGCILTYAFVVTTHNYLYFFFLLILFISFHFHSMHFMLNIFNALHLFTCISLYAYHASHLMLFILSILFYILHYIHLFLCIFIHCKL